MRSRATRSATTTNSSIATASGTTTRATGASGCRRTLTGVTIRSATAPGSASDSAGAGSIPCRGASTRSTAGAGRTCITGIAGAGCRSGIITRGAPRRKRTRSDILAMMRGRETIGGMRRPGSLHAGMTASEGRLHRRPSIPGASMRIGDRCRAPSTMTVRRSAVRPRGRVARRRCARRDRPNLALRHRRGRRLRQNRRLSRSRFPNGNLVPGRSFVVSDSSLCPP